MKKAVTATSTLLLFAPKNERHAPPQALPLRVTSLQYHPPPPQRGTHARTASFLSYLLSPPLPIHILPVSHQMTLVISSPSRSTTGFFTAIFLALRAVAVLAKLRVCAFATEDSADTGRIDRLASRIAAPVALELTMLRAERGTGHTNVSWAVLRRSTAAAVSAVRGT